MKGRVSISGYIEEEKFVEYMEMTDIVVNLRYPYHGESSGTLARAFGMGKCVIVNNVGAFSELPDNTCIKIPSVEGMSGVEEVEQIYLAIKKAFDNEYSHKIAENAYLYALNEISIPITAGKYIK